MAATKRIYRLNDYNDKAWLRQINPSTGIDAPLTTGTVVGLISTGHESTDTAFDASWQVNGTYVGNEDDDDGNSCGAWIFNVDGANLTLALLNAAVTVNGTYALDSTTNVVTGTLYFIVKKEGDVRIYRTLKYVSSRKATIQ